MRSRPTGELQESLETTETNKKSRPTSELQESLETTETNKKKPDQVEQSQTKESPSLDNLKKKESDKVREEWGAKLSFILCSIAYVVGLGNVWRFPKLVYENGGGAFLIPYGIMLMLFGLPAVYAEFIVGQTAQVCAARAYRNMAPIFQGLGWSMCLFAIGTAIYYNVLICWATLYIYETLRIPFEGTVWSKCNNPWNDQKCVSASANKLCVDSTRGIYPISWNESCVGSVKRFLHLANISSMDQSQPATEQYFLNHILWSTQNISEIGHFNWKIFIALSLVWVLTCVVTMFGTKFIGYTAYLTATLPYIFTGFLFVRGATLPNAFGGIRYLFYQTDFTKVWELKVWINAATQVAYSLSIGLAGLSDFASCNKPKYNCFRDATIVVAADTLMSVFSAIGVFGILGFLASASNRNVEDVIMDGSSLAFIVYPEATTMMSTLGWIFGLFFFIMLFIIGFGTVVGLVSVFVNGLVDMFPKFFRGRSRFVFTPLVCLFCLVCGMSMCFGNGRFVLDLFDSWVGSLGDIFCLSVSLLVISYVYGIRNFMSDTRAILGKPRNCFTKWIFGPHSAYFIVCWMFISPFIGFFACISEAVYLFQNQKENPTWVVVIGSILLASEFFPIIGFALWNTLSFLCQKKELTQLFRVQPEHPSYHQIKAKRKLWAAFREKITWDDLDDFDTVEEDFL